MPPDPLGDIAGVIAEAAPAEPPPPDDRELADLDRNDYGNAQRLIARFGADLIHVDGAGWYVWDGIRWARCNRENSEAIKRTHLVAQKIADEAAALGADVTAAEIELQRLEAEAEGGMSEPIAAAKARLKAVRERQSAHFKFGISSGNAGKSRAMLEAAQPYCERPAAALDADPLLVSVANGTLELGGPEIRLRPHDRADLVTQCSPVAYDPEADCPQWHAFLDRILPSAALQRFVQQLLGYALTGLTGEQLMFIFYGSGANGKSTLVETVARVLGDYAVSVAVQTFLADDVRRGGDATPDLARLPGRRLVTAAEPEVGAKLSETMVKTVTGGDRVTARHLFQDLFEFRPCFKFILLANIKPAIRGQDEGIWRRVKLVPFTQVIPREERDRHLMAKLAAEAAGILNWLLDGYRMYRETGLQDPPEVAAATETYRSESDPIGEFMRACTARVAGASVQAKRLYAVYCDWAKANGIEPASGTLFGRRLGDMGYVKQKTGIVHYRDLELTQDSFGGLDSSSAGGGSTSGPAGAPPPSGIDDYGA
jgi:putative DNA primase/helicase